MRFPKFDLMDWMIENQQVKHNLGSSCMKTPEFSEFGINPVMLDLDDIIKHGDGPLVESIRDTYEVPEECVLTTAGASEANLLVFMGLLEVGDDVIIERPNYYAMEGLPKGLGARVRYLDRRPDEGFRLNLDRLNVLMSRKTKLLVLTNLHNPSGVSISEKELSEVLAMAEDYGVHVLVDEMYREAMFHDTPPLSTSLSENAIVTSGITKNYGLGALRCGWLIAEEWLVKKFMRVREYTSIWGSPISQYLGAAALEKRDYFLGRARRILNENRPLLEEFIESKEYLDWVEPDGGNMSFPAYDLDISSEELARKLLKEYEVFVTPGKYFGLEGHLRITFGALDREAMREALAVLGDALDDLYMQG